VRKVLIALVVLALVYGLYSAVRANGAADRAEADARPLFVPIIVTGSVQPVNGQVVLYKATNMHENPMNFRLSIYNDTESVPGVHKDFMKVPGGHSVSYVYEPPKSELTLGAATVEAPAAVRATFAPVPADDPGAVRKLVVNVQLMRVVPGANGAPATLDNPIIVPLEHCNFEPRGFVPYTGGRWYWNCAPDIFPMDEMWRLPGQNRR
jgi:hypothetical protein